MAPRPQERLGHDDIERMIKDIIARLYTIQIQVSAYDTAGGRPTKDVLANEIKALSSSLSLLSLSISSSPTPQPVTSSSSSTSHPPSSSTTGPSSSSIPPAPAILPSIPRDLIEYVENSRNPDIYTREFVELARRWNQIMRGKLLGFAAFTDVLADAIRSAMPELTGDVKRIIDATASTADTTSAALGAGGVGVGVGGDPERMGIANANGNRSGNGTF